MNDAFHQIGARVPRAANGVVRALPCALLVALGCLVAGLHPASAAARDLPAQLSVTVRAPTGTDGPPPTGDITVSVDGVKIATVPLTRATNSLTRVTPLLSAALKLLGREATITYSGDSNYEASEGVTVTLPTRTVLTIVADPRTSKPPVIEILSPDDGPVSDGGAPAASAGSSSSPPPPPAAAGSPPPASAAEPAAAQALVGAASATAAPNAAAPRRRPAATRGSSARAATRGSSAATSSLVPRAQTKPAAQEYAPYDPRSEPAKSVAILVTMFTLLQFAGAGGGLARAGGGGGGSGRAPSGGSSGSEGRGRGDSSGPSPSMAYEGVNVSYLGAGLGAVAIGDRSRTWAWPGTRAIDRLGASVPARLARRSPLLARLTADSTYLRAILGSASLLTLTAGTALGILALQDTGGEAVPPAAALTIAIAVLGVLDAAAGLTAVLVFMFGTLATRGVDSGDEVRLLLGLSALWCIVPVLAGAVRPLRRQRLRRLDEWWDRAADFVIASLIGAWAVQKIVLSLPGLAGKELPIADHANLAAYCVLAALTARLTLETVAAHLYPQRLDRTEPDLPAPGSLQRLGACVLRAAVFVFFAYIVVGTSWQLWVGAALFVIPQVLAVFEERFPNSAALYKVLPKGLVELVVMLFVGTAVGALLISAMDENAESFLATCFVLLSLPGFVLSLAQLLGRQGEEPKIGWGKRLGGVVLVVVGVLLVLGMIL